MASFKTLLRKGVQVSGGDRVALGTLVLEVGGAQETVNVISEAPLLQAQSGERSYVISSAQVENLPLSNRNFASLASLAPGRRRDQPHRRRRPDELRDGRRLGRGHRQQQPDAAAECRSGRRGEGPDRQLPGGVRTLERTADHGRDQERHQPVPRLSLRREAQLGLEHEQLGQHAERRPESGHEAGRLGLQHRWAGRQAGRHQQAVLLLQPGIPAAHRRRDRRTFRVPTALERQGDFSQTRDNTGDPLSVHSRRQRPDLPCTRDEHVGLLPGWRRRRPHPAEPPVCAWHGHPEQPVAAAERQPADRR